MARLDLLAAVAALLGAAAGCNTILGTEPPPSGTGGAAGGTTTGSMATGGMATIITETGGAPCGGPEWTHWNPTAEHTYTPITAKDGTSVVAVIDALTRLAWQTQPAAGTMSWGDADKLCRDFEAGGLQGFRLPTLVELASLTRYDKDAPTLDAEAFPDAAGGEFWTSSFLDELEQSAYYVSHGDGHIRSQKTYMKASVRCVRDLKPPADTTCVRYVLEDDGKSVRDTETGLVWQKSPSSEEKEWKLAMEPCKALGGAWRLPKVSELITLLDVARKEDPRLDPDFFDPLEPGMFHWTATGAFANSSSAWNVDTGTSVVNKGATYQEFRVRCVR